MSQLLCKLILKTEFGLREEAFEVLVRKLVTSLEHAFKCAESADKHVKVGSMVSLLRSCLEYMQVYQDDFSGTLKMLEQMQVHTILANALRRFDLSSTSLPNSVNALLKTIQYLLVHIYKSDESKPHAKDSSILAPQSTLATHIAPPGGPIAPSTITPTAPEAQTQTPAPPTTTPIPPISVPVAPVVPSPVAEQSTGAPISVNAMHVAPSPAVTMLRTVSPTPSSPVLSTPPSPVDDDDEDEDSPAQANEEVYGEGYNSEKNFEVCPLVHPMLKHVLRETSPSNTMLYCKSCQPLSQQTESVNRFPIVVSPYGHNSVVILHGFQASACDFANRLVSCSSCRWFQESALLDGQAMSHPILLAVVDILEHCTKGKPTAQPTALENPSTSESVKKINAKEEQALKEKDLGDTDPFNGISKVDSTKESQQTLASLPTKDELTAKQYPVDTNVPEVVTVQVVGATPTSATSKQFSVNESLTKTEKTNEQTETKVQAKSENKTRPNEPTTKEPENTAPNAELDLINEFAKFVKLPQFDYSKGGKTNTVGLVKVSPLKESLSEQFKVTPEQRAILGDSPLPEGLDPAILVELPEDLRREAIQDHFAQTKTRILPIPVQQGTPMTGGTVTVANHMPQRNAVVIQVDEETATAQTANFIRTLSAPMRRMVLSELDDTQLRFLPDDIIAEVLTLRQEAARQILRHEVQTTRNNENELRTAARATVVGRALSRNSGFGLMRRTLQNRLTTGASPSTRHSRRQLMDSLSMNSLLMLLFVDNKDIQWSIYNTLFATICGNEETRKFVADSLLFILAQTNPRPATSGPSTVHECTSPTAANQGFSNLKTIASITFKTTFGAKVPVFQVLIHPQLPPELILHPDSKNFVLSKVLEIFNHLGPLYPDMLLPPLEMNASAGSPLGKESKQEESKSSILEKNEAFKEAIYLKDAKGL